MNIYETITASETKYINKQLEELIEIIKNQNNILINILNQINKKNEIIKK